MLITFLLFVAYQMQMEQMISLLC